MWAGAMAEVQAKANCAVIGKNQSVDLLVLLHELLLWAEYCTKERSGNEEGERQIELEHPPWCHQR